MSDASDSGHGPYSNVYYFTQVTEFDHAGVLWIVGVLCLLYPIISAFVRLSVRAPRYGIDDYVLVGSTVSQDFSMPSELSLTDLLEDLVHNAAHSPLCSSCKGSG